MGKTRLRLSPSPVLVFAGWWGVNAEAKLVVENTDAKCRVAFKLKTTDNELFRCRPTMGIVEEGGTFDVSVVFRPKEEKAPVTSHHLTLSEDPLPGGDVLVFNARKVWDTPRGRHIPSHTRLPFRFRTTPRPESAPDAPKTHKAADPALPAVKAALAAINKTPAVPIVEIEDDKRSMCLDAPGMDKIREQMKKDALKQKNAEKKKEEALAAKDKGQTTKEEKKATANLATPTSNSSGQKMESKKDSGKNPESKSSRLNESELASNANTSSGEDNTVNSV